MNLLSSARMEIFLLAGYVTFSIFLNFLALLISAFYEKKFNQTSPKVGFVIAIILSVIFIVFLFATKSNTVSIISVFVLLGSSIASAFSVLNLFFTMRKVQK
jgi:hypothetical protein